jgi:hypothetical protein
MTVSVRRMTIDRGLRRLGFGLGGAAVLFLAAACRGGGEDLRAERRVQLPDTVAAGATLALDSLGRAWVGEPGRLTVYDTAGRPAARLEAGGATVPRVLWWMGGLVYVRAERNVSAIDPATRERAGTRTVDPVARDPRGRWLYTAGRRGGVLGLTPGSMATRWGWPDPGSRASAIAASPLGDRVYVALAGNDDNGVEPSIEVRDALTGRVLSTAEISGPVRVLESGPDNTLYALTEDAVTALRHGPDGLATLWTTGVEGEELRVSPAGSRVAVLERGRGLRVLDAATGRVVGRTDEAPRDAAYDVAGRLWLLHPREIRIAP